MTTGIIEIWKLSLNLSTIRFQINVRWKSFQVLFLFSWYELKKFVDKKGGVKHSNSYVYL